MGKKGDTAVDKLYDAFRVVVFGAFLIVIAVLFFQALLDTLGIPSWVKYVVYALLVFFVYIMRDKAIEFTKKILK